MHTMPSWLHATVFKDAHIYIYIYTHTHIYVYVVRNLKEWTSSIVFFINTYN
jgi:hypothetical protein